MKVNIPPPATPELVQPGGSSPQGQSERALEQDADLFKQAMGDITANPFTIIFGVALISLLPILVSIGTAFLKFVVVFNLLSDH